MKFSFQQSITKFVIYKIKFIESSIERNSWGFENDDIVNIKDNWDLVTIETMWIENSTYSSRKCPKRPRAHSAVAPATPSPILETHSQSATAILTSWPGRMGHLSIEASYSGPCARIWGLTAVGTSLNLLRILNKPAE